MFLDPEPKRRKTSRDMSSGFFASQRPVASPRDQSRPIWRQALQERSDSQNNRRPQDAPPVQPTVRLVTPSPSPPTQHATVRLRRDDDAKENWQAKAPTPLPRSTWVKEASVSNPSITAASRDGTVSDPLSSANKAQIVDRAPNITLLPSTAVHELPSPTWHRRSTSSGMYSQSSTLQESEIAFSKKSLKSERYSNFSQISTLRGTPTPYDQEHREEHVEAENEITPGSLPVLQTSQNVCPEQPERRTTIRPVSPSESPSPIEPASTSQSTETSPVRPHTAPSDPEELPSTSPLSRSGSRRAYSTGSIQPLRGRANTQNTIASSTQLNQERSWSQATTESKFPQSSSPNLIAYSPDSDRPVSREPPLHRMTSLESISSRLQYVTLARPATGQTLASSSSWASLQSSDILPPLQVSRKRLRHKAKSDSLAALAGSSRAVDTMEEEIDTFPYRRRPFGSYLSTIASESEHSRSTSLHLSHFSLGSGVLTGDDASSLPLSPTHRRQSSAPIESLASSLRSPEMQRRPSIDSTAEAGDMTLGIYREESAIPQPLFRPSQGQSREPSRHHNDPFPALPDDPGNRDSDEYIDTLSALQVLPLKLQRSWVSLRQRNNSTPGHSRQQSQISYADSERFSQGSNLFPVWARRFYSGTAVLRSKVSLNSMTNSEKRRPIHRRYPSSVTDRSITSRLGTGRAEVESSSPGSSHFLPSIFRPQTRTRKQGASRSDSRSFKVRKSRRARRSQETRDSMAIEPAPPLPADAPNLSHEFLPSGQPKWGTLKDSPSASPDPQRRLPKKYSKQRLWDHMEFPRPMTKDRLGEFNVTPAHLAPSKRVSQQGLSAWQAPSFVSSLDTLITSKNNRQILCFTLGFVCPLTWMLGAILPLPKRPISVDELEKRVAGIEEGVQAAMMQHAAGDAEKRWREERQFFKARWWRMLNRIMSVIGVLVIGAVVALAVFATS